MSKNTLVTGASGFIAQQLILDLLDQGHAVRGTVRSLSNAEALTKTLGSHSARDGTLRMLCAAMNHPAAIGEPSIVADESRSMTDIARPPGPPGAGQQGFQPHPAGAASPPNRYLADTTHGVDRS